MKTQPANIQTIKNTKPPRADERTASPYVSRPNSRVRRITLKVCLISGIMLMVGAFCPIPCEAAPLVLPDNFPINMGFKSLTASTTGTAGYFNEGYDILATAIGKTASTGLRNFPIHHGDLGSMRRIKNNAPDAITIVYNAGQGIPTACDAAGIGNIFPGYYLYYMGTQTTGTLNATDTTSTVSVANVNVFDPLDQDRVIIYNRNNDGTPNWGSFEYAVVIGTSPTAVLGASPAVAGTVTLARGTTVSGVTNMATTLAAKKSFPSGAYIAAHVNSWEKDESNEADQSVQFRINVSMDAPVCPAGFTANGMNKVGKNGWQVRAEGAAAGLMGSNADGMEEDVSYSTFGKSTLAIDVDNNGVADWGYIGGINSYNLGYQKYSELLRGAVGPDKIIQFDSINPRKGYRGWKYVNGVQMETFMDGKAFSQAYEHLSQWVEKAEATPAFSYGFCRRATTLYPSSPYPVTLDNNQFRKQFAVGLMIGMPHPYGSDLNFGLFDWDEQRGGTLNNYQWLGKAVTPASRESATGTNNYLAYLSGTKFEKPGYSGTLSGSLLDTVNGVQINVSTIPAAVKPNESAVTLRLQANAPLPAATAGQPLPEYTLTFEAKAQDTFTYKGETFRKMPRLITITTVGTNPGGDSMCVLADGVEYPLSPPSVAAATWRTYMLSFPANPTGNNLRVDFGVSETTGTTWIRNVKLTQGTSDRLSREFEHGKVYLNMSNAPWYVTVTGGSYKHLAGTLSNPDANAANPANDGTTIGVSGGPDVTLTIPSNDAVFLVKTP